MYRPCQRITGQQFNITISKEITSYTHCMWAECNFCDRNFTAVSSNEISCQRIIRQKIIAHIRETHASDPRINYTPEQRLLCAIFGVTDMADIPPAPAEPAE